MKPLPKPDLEHVLTHTAALWESAKNSHFFITGGTGFFGIWLLESFAHCNRVLALNARATVLSREPSAFQNRFPHLADESSIRWLRGDVSSFKHPDEQIDFIIHAATPTSGPSASQSRDLLRTIIDGTERMIELAEKRGPRSFLLASSGAVYGRQPENVSRIPEDYHGGPDWLDPKASYAEGKRIAEHLCSASSKRTDIRFALARGFAFVGPHLPLDQHFAIGNFIRDALARRNIEIRGDGTPTRSYLHVADLAIWLWTMLLSEAPDRCNPLVLNVGSGEEFSIREIAEAVVNELNPSLEIHIARQPQPGQPREQYVPDVRKAKSHLGLEQKIGLREAIRRTAAWYRQH